MKKLIIVLTVLLLLVAIPAYAMNLYIYYAGQTAGEKVENVTEFWTSEGFVHYVWDNNRIVQPINSGDKVIRKVIISGW